MPINDHIADLIAKQLKGQASEAEHAELQQWLEADETHRSLYQDLQQIWQESGKAFEQPTFNTTAAWNKLDTTIQKRQADTATTHRTHNSIFYIKRIAIAAAIAGIVITGWYFFTKDNTTWQTITAAGAHQTIFLPDSSEVLLRKGSTISYPTHFSSQSRPVKLTAGEAYFQVRHAPDQPFIITTAYAAIKVLGTSFVLHTDKASDEVVVLSGKVSVKERSKSAEPVVLTSGQKAVVDNQELIHLTNTDSNYLSWKTGMLVFNGTPLMQVLPALQRYYQAPLALSGDLPRELQQASITARFDHQPLEQVLEEIRLTTGLLTKNQGDTIVLYKN